MKVTMTMNYDENLYWTVKPICGNSTFKYNYRHAYSRDSVVFSRRAEGAILVKLFTTAAGWLSAGYEICGPGGGGGGGHFHIEGVGDVPLARVWFCDHRD